MIQVIFLACLGILIFKVVWQALGVAENLLLGIIRVVSPKAFTHVTEDVKSSSKVSGSNNSSQVLGSSSKVIKEQGVKSNVKTSSKSEISNSSVGPTQSKQEDNRGANLSGSIVDKVETERQKTENSPVKPKQTVSVMGRQTKHQKPLSAEPKVEEDISMDKISQGEKSAYEERINRLKEQVQAYRKQKIIYIQRIQEIIQHVVNETEQHEEQSRASTECEQMSSINTLKHEVNASIQKMQDEKRQIIEEAQREKAQLIKEYELKLGEISKSNSDKIMEYSNIINQVTTRLYQLEEEKAQKILKDNNTSEGNNISNEQLEQIIKGLNDQRAKNKDLLNSKMQLQQKLSKLQEQQPQSNIEIRNLKQNLVKIENDALQAQAKLEAQISSLSTQKIELNQDLTFEKKKRIRAEQELQQIKSQRQHEQNSSETALQQHANTDTIIQNLQQQLRTEKQLRQEETTKASETLEELKFCQEQLKNARQTESQLRSKLVQAAETPKKPIVRKEDVEKHPEFINMKRRLEQLQGSRRLLTPQQGTEKYSSSIHPHHSPKEPRQVSPSFQNVSQENKRSAISPNSQSRGTYRSGLAANNSKSPSLVPPQQGSTILDRRYKTPSEKPVPQSTINRMDNLEEVFLGQTNILNEEQRNLIVKEISALKRINTKKTRIMFSSSQKVNKSIADFFVSIPNMIVVIELSNKAIVGAFTQNAFSRQNRFTQSTVVSKAMIFSLQSNVFLPNDGKGQIIHFKENTLTWGNQEFVINCEEPISVSANLNCQNAIYPSNVSTQDFLGSKDSTVSITKLEVHRSFFG